MWCLLKSHLLNDAPNYICYLFPFLRSSRAFVLFFIDHISSLKALLRSICSILPIDHMPYNIWHVSGILLFFFLSHNIIVASTCRQFIVLHSGEPSWLSFVNKRIWISQVLLELARNRNKIPLPKSISGPGIALPPDEDTLVSPNYQLAIPVKQTSQAVEETEDEEMADPNPEPTQEPKSQVPLNASQQVSFSLGAKRPRGSIWNTLGLPFCNKMLNFDILNNRLRTSISSSMFMFIWWGSIIVISVYIDNLVL